MKRKGMFKVANEEERATVYIYGTIGEDWNPEDENRAKAFAQTLDELSPKPLDLRIDSPGGSVFEGFAIASAIRRYEGETHAYIDGLAASAASYIALMADKVTMHDFSMFMIHNAWGICVGNREDMREMADRLEQIDGAIAGVIYARSHMELDEVKEAMNAETWYAGPEALEAGFCDEVIETGERIAACIDRSLADKYRNVPEFLVIADASDGDDVPAAQALETGEVAEAVEGGAGVTSHQVSIVPDNEVTAPAGAILLGNRIYRKEQ